MIEFLGIFFFKSTFLVLSTMGYFGFFYLIWGLPHCTTPVTNYCHTPSNSADYINKYFLYYKDHVLGRYELKDNRTCNLYHSSNLVKKRHVTTCTSWDVQAASCFSIYLKTKRRPVLSGPTPLWTGRVD